MPRPDVLAVQEANLQRWGGATHLDDVRGLLGGLGYQITSTDYSQCTAWCTRGAHIFFNPSRMSLAALPTGAPPAGMAGMSTIAGVDFGGTQDRNVSYAFLTPVGSGVRRCSSPPICPRRRPPRGSACVSPSPRRCARGLTV